MLGAVGATTRREGARSHEVVPAGAVGRRSGRRLLAGVLLGLVALVPAVRVAQLTVDGVGATPDGAVYLGVARNLVDGEGITSPVSSKLDSIPPDDAVDLVGETPLLRWPPGYPAVLALGATATGADPATVARVVAVLAATATAACSWVLARRWTGSLAWATAAALVVGLEPGLLGLSPVVSSEGLYLALSLGAVVAADRWWRTGSTVAFAMAAGAAGVAWTVRFTGVALVAALALGVLVRSVPGGGGVRGVLRARWRELALLGIAAAPAVLWSLHLERSPYREAHRRLRGVPGEELGLFVDTVGSWFASRLDGVGSAAVLVAVALVAGAGAVRLGRRGVVPGSLVVLHLGVVLFSAVWVRQVALGGRVLSPVQPVVVCLAAVGLAAGARWLARRLAERDVRRARALVPLAAVVLGGLAVGAHLARGDELRPAVPPQPVPGLEARIGRVPDDVVVFANDATSLYLITGRDVVSVPARRWQESDVVDDGYPAKLDQLVDLVAEGRAVVVLFPTTAFFDDSLVTVAELEAAGLTVEVLDDDTVVVTA